MYVIKRGGQRQVFDFAKIEKALEKTFRSVNGESYNGVPQILLKDIKTHLGVTKECHVEDIQDIVEKSLMDWKFFDAAKAYILYREQHNQIRIFTNKKKQFIENYKKASTTADATIDDNANVSNHNIAVLNAELHKEDTQQLNFRAWRDKIQELYPDFDYKQFDTDINTILHPHDSSSQYGMPYCVAVTMYPYYVNGIKNIGGLSGAPKHLSSFCTMFTNMMFDISSQFKGAVAVPGFFLGMDYFCRKRWGDDYYLRKDKCVASEECLEKQTIEEEIDQWFQTICYTLMQPSAARSMQAVFWNVSIFDKAFYDTMYSDFYFPDGTRPNWDSFNYLQKHFMTWLNKERLTCMLTFPVVSIALIYKDGEFADKEMYDFVCQEYSEGDSFFTYISDSADSLSSCCRLSSKIDKPQFNFTNGQIGESTGSKNVITLDLNRIVQDWVHTTHTYSSEEPVNPRDGLDQYLIAVLDRVYKYQTAYNALLKDLKDAGMLPVYDAGFIDMKRQYLTIGINGLNQAAEFLGMECTKNEGYMQFCKGIFSIIKEQNALHKTKDLMFNTEFTPCESAAIKLYNRDKKDGYWVPEDTNLYASYIFKPNDPNISVLDKIYLHGRDFCGDALDGGSAAHINLEEHLSKAQYEKVVKYAAEVGCKYFTFNIPNSECKDCGYITKHPITKCPKCGSENISLWDRIIGYLTEIKHWSEGRRIEQKTRIYSKMEND